MAADAQRDMALASGVDTLIARLRDEGVTAGKEQADQILAAARAEAKQVRDRANAEAQQRLEAARRESDAYRAAGEDALRTAVRDTVLDMKTRLMDRFSADVRRLISSQLKETDVLRQMIIEIAGRVGESTEMAQAREVEILLPASAAGLEELRRNPDELERGRLTQLVHGLTSDMLREGVTLGPSNDVTSGIHVRIKDSDVTIDLTDEAVAHLILQHLQPRFRAVLEGIVK